MANDEKNTLSRFGYELESIYEVPVSISAVIGRTAMTVSQVLKLGRGAIIELDKKIGDPIDIMVNNKIIAKGEIVSIGSDKIGINMIEISKNS